jgi:hypothetical protein
VTDNAAIFAPSTISHVYSMSHEEAVAQGLIEVTGDELAAEKAKRIERSQRFAAEGAAERAQPGRPVTIDALLAQLGWSAAYAQHRLHPGCSCTTGYDGDSDYLCSWAEWLGFTTTNDTPEPVSAEEVEAKAAAHLAESIAATERWNGKPLRIRDLFPTSFVTLSPITYPAGANVDYPMGPGQ